MRHPLVLAVVMAGLCTGDLAAQPTRGGSGTLRPGRGPDLTRLNHAATRVLGRPDTGPFGFLPFLPYYAPVVYGPPFYYDVPPFMYDPFQPYTRYPELPPALLPPKNGAGNKAPNAPANNQPPPPPPKPAAPPKDDLDMKAEMQKHIRAGNEAMANGEYGLAAKRYEQAVSAAPVEPAGYFHLAQAQLAVGKYSQAVASIQRGLRMHAKWPESGFQPRALYGDRGGDYDQHLAQLADVISKNLNDDSLLFLLAYQLWFDGERGQATQLLERAAALAFDTTFIDRFLKGPKVAGP